MTMEVSDIGFVGEAYEAPMLLQDAQRCINWYCEISEDKTDGSKMPIALLGCPGLNQVTVSNTSSGTFGGPVNFATGDGTTTNFGTGDPNLSIEQVFIKDWQGTQLQYTTPRTNVAVNNITATGYSSPNYTLGTAVNGGPDNGSTAFFKETTATGVIFQAQSNAGAGTVSIGDFFTFIMDFALSAGYSNNENKLSISFSNLGLIGGVIPNANIDIAAHSVLFTSSGVTAAFISTLPNGFVRFSFVIGSATINNSAGPFFTAEPNFGSSINGDGITQLYIRHDIKKTQTISGWIKNNTSSAITVTDYSVVTTSAIFSIAPINGAVLSKQTFTPGVGGPSQIRGMWTLPGNTSSLVVAGSLVYLMSVAIPATTRNPATFNFVQVGTLLTSTGPVSIRDNGVIFGGKGGYAVIVDGQFGYYYLLSGVQKTVVFTGGVSSGTANITVSPIPNGVVAGAAVTVTDSSGFIPANTLITGANFNTPSLTMSQNATNTNASDTITITIPVFGQITDTAFLPASMVSFIEGWLIFSQPGTRTFFTNATTPYTMLFAGSFFALKDSSTDNLVTLYENNREVWLVGERTSEVWYNSGNPNFAFSRIPAIGPQIGCAATHSITRLGPDLVWLGRNEQGQNIVVKQVNYQWERISTHAIDHAIASYAVVSDAIGFAYEEEGHWFYVLTFPTADATWVYDGKTKMWHQRGAWDITQGVYHRFRANAFCDLADMRLVGDYQNGNIYQMSRNFYTDGGNVLRCQRRAPHIWNKPNRKRLFHSQVQVEFTPGVGLNAGQGNNPQAMLRWYDYVNNQNWSNEYWRSIGKTGEVRNRAIWRTLGTSRDRIYELNFSDPVPRDIIGVTLFFEPESDADAQLSRTA